MVRPPPSAYPPQVDWAAPLPEHPLGLLLDEAVRRFADRPCLDFLGRRYSFAEVGRLVAHAAAGFHSLGVGKGTRVGLFLPNTPYYVVCYYAILKCGGIVVNFNPLYAEQEVRHLVTDSGAEIMVTLDLAALYSPVARMLGQGRLRHIVVCGMAGVLPFPQSWLFRFAKRREIASWPRDAAHSSFAALIANDGAVPTVAIEPQSDIAVLQYTGGTTGTPKGAMLTHRNLVANAIQCQLWFHGTSASERVLAVLPFFHVFAMTTAMNLSIASGSEIILLPRFDLAALLRTIERKKPTIFPGVPTLFTAINNHPDIARYDLSSIRHCISGGAPLPLEVKTSFEGLTGCMLVEGYGLSETSPVVACNPFGGVNKPGSVGLPLPGTVIEILALDGSGEALPTGERGEIAVRGPQVMAGYWQKPEETARVLQGGRLRTGDVGYLDEDGYLFIVDRLKDVIIASGYKIFPRNVEEAIYQHPATAECVVIGVKDAYRGQTVKAFVVLRHGQALTREELLAFLHDKLSPMEMPKEIEFRASLPKTAIGKLSKKELIAAEEARRAGAAHGSF
ncbi:MAG TPA: long-chain fatty acid--CoA ligase [Stellaceae bacterium]|nr:long-chain fatty acid--CoA ligase [Stellaceae bacterium]